MVGLGRFGQRRLASLRADPRFHVVAGCDPQGTLDLPPTATPVALGADIAVIAVPPGLAPALVVEALTTGHHVLCEKPPALDGAGLAGVPELVHSRVLRYGFNHRLHPAVREARRRLPSLGPLREVSGVYERPSLAPTGGWRARPEAGGGILRDQGIHLVDLCYLLAGPLSLESAGVRREPSGAETHVEALLRGAGGVPVHFVSSAEAPAHRFRLELRGDRGTLRLEGLATSSGAYAPERLVSSTGEALEWDHDDSLDRERDLFADALGGAPGLHGTLKDATVVLSLVDAMLQGPP